MSSGKKVEICVTIIQETERAFKVTDTDETGSFWLPKSQLEYEHSAGVGDTVVMEVARWLADEKGLL